MKLPLSGGEWLFTTGAIYLIVAIINIWFYKFASTDLIQLVWILVTALPLVIPMSKIVSMKPLRENNERPNS